MNSKLLSLILALAVAIPITTTFYLSNSHKQRQRSTETETVTVDLLAKSSDFSLDALDSDELHYRVSLFRDWTAKFDKQYGATELPLRFQAWNNNYEFVQTHNAKNLSWTVEMNKFADLSREEFAALYMGLNAAEFVRDPEHEEEQQEEESAEEGEDDASSPSMASETVDWRTGGAVTKIKDQGQCGACYAFASAAGLEGLYKIKKGTLKAFSPQQIAACSSSYSNQGCNGGLMTYSYSYTQAKGIESETEYPWTGSMTSCKYSSSKVVFKNSGYKNVAASYTSLKAAVKAQPVPVGVEADQSAFQLYKSGTISSDCGTSIDHAITAVGYVYTGSLSSSYWIVKNQWGTSWGESGYVKIKMGKDNNGAGVCGINSMATYPTL